MPVPVSTPAEAPDGLCRVNELSGFCLQHERPYARCKEAARLSLGQATEPYEQVDHPKHYQMPGGVEVIDLVEHLSFNTGNAIKYLARAGRKPGTRATTDIEKAIWYCQRELARLRGQS